MKIIGLQYDIAWENKAENFRIVRRMVEAAVCPPGTLLVLPEMFATGFSMNATGIAEPYGGETEWFLSDLAREFRIFVVGGAAARSSSGKLRNKALVFSPEGKLVAWYAKMRPFTPGGEAEHFAAGTAPVWFDCGGIKVSPFICYDVRFPELFRAIAHEARPELFVVIANFPTRRIGQWELLLRARAIENQAFVVGVNRIGKDPVTDYCGHSIVVDPTGEVVAHAGEAECIVSAELDLARLRQYRQGLPFLDDLKWAVHQPRTEKP